MIGLIINNLAGSGAERVVLQIAQMFQKKGHTVHIFLLENVIKLPLPKKVFIHPLTKKRTFYKSLARLGDSLFARKLSGLIHSIEKNSGHSFSVLMSYSPSADKILAGISHSNKYFCIHSSYLRELEEMKQKGRHLRAIRRLSAYRRIYKNNNIIAISEGVKSDFLRMKIPIESIRVIYNPFDRDYIRQQAEEVSTDLPDYPYIVHAGGYRPVKRHDILLEAFSQVKTDRKLVLMTEPFPELLALIKKFNLQDRVTITGFKSNPYPFIKQADLMVLTSDREGLPTVLIESLICGVPVVSTDCISGPSEILTGELSKWLVPVGNVNDFARIIKQALQEKIIVTDENTKKFTQENIFREYIDLIKGGE